MASIRSRDSRLLTYPPLFFGIVMMQIVTANFSAWQHEMILAEIIYVWPDA